MRRIVLAATLAAGLVFAGSAAAMAVEGGNVEDPTPSTSATGYTPVDPSDPTLAGSAWSACVNDTPYINYDISLVDPDNKATTHAATLVMSNGSQSVEIGLGQVASNGSLKGSVLWPGAKVENGVGAGWPGWAFQNGEWVATDGNYAWTRGNISSVIKVNPELTVKLSYPPGNPECMTSPRSSGDQQLPLTLPATGMNSVVLPIGIAAGAVLVVGVTFLLVQRRRSRA
ncbi:MAG: LPXTG cell wall anchor domain-containing protein [Microbacterium sp.]